MELWAAALPLTKWGVAARRPAVRSSSASPVWKAERGESVTTIWGKEWRVESGTGARGGRNSRPMQSCVVRFEGWRCFERRCIGTMRSGCSDVPDGCGAGCGVCGQSSVPALTETIRGNRHFQSVRTRSGRGVTRVDVQSRRGSWRWDDGGSRSIRLIEVHRRA